MNLLRHNPSEDSQIPREDLVWLKRAMRVFGIRKLAISWSNSTLSYPDIWVTFRERFDEITVTREWARQDVDERRKRLIHELLHIKGLKHGRFGGYYYATVPTEDSYSKMVYDDLREVIEQRKPFRKFAKKPAVAADIKAKQLPLLEKVGTKVNPKDGPVDLRAVAKKIALYEKMNYYLIMKAKGEMVTATTLEAKVLTYAAGLMKDNGLLFGGWRLKTKGDEILTEKSGKPSHYYFYSQKFKLLTRDNQTIAAGEVAAEMRKTLQALVWRLDKIRVSFTWVAVPAALRPEQNPTKR